MIGDYDYSNEMKALGVNLDLLKDRAQDVITAFRHSLSSGSNESSPFDPAVSNNRQRHLRPEIYRNNLIRLLTSLKSSLRSTLRRFMMLPRS